MATTGMELLFASVQHQIKSDNDCLMCALHWNMISHSFRCLGIGEQFPQENENTTKSELLPTDWNANQELYTLRYQPGDSSENFLLKAVVVNGSILLHVMRVRDEKVATMDIQVSDFVLQDYSSYNRTYRNLSELQKQFKISIIGEFKPAELKKEPRPRQEARQPYSEDPLRVGPRRIHRPPEWGEPSNPFAVGGGDLDPLGREPGGMLMDPLRSGFPRPGTNPEAGLPGRLPRGAVPPGARFDPFGPDIDARGEFNPAGGFRTGPDPDHMRPPGYDDMFM